MIDTIVQRLLQLMQTIGYPGLGLAMFIESFFAPIPSELVLPFAWWLAAEWQMNIWLAIIVSWVCAYLGSLPFYLIGYRGNEQKITTFIKKYGKYFFITEADVDQWFRFFERFGKMFVFFGRLIPIVRTVVSFPAGAVKMDFVQFSILTLWGSLVRSTFLISAGYAFGENYAQVQVWMGKYEHVVLPIILACIIARIGHKVYRKFWGKK